MRVLVVGCGYVGLPLAAALARAGHEVCGVRRSNGGEAAMLSANIRPFAADITRPEDLAKLPGPFDWVVNCVSSSRSGPAEYRAVYLEGTRLLLDWLAASPPKKYVYTGSTSVYGQKDGSPVNESSPTQPATETGLILLEVEESLIKAARESDFPAVILRVAGIYGPGRGHLFQQYLRDEARLAGSGDRIINMIHLDDVIGAAVAALEKGRPGAIYNAVDDEPVSQLEFFRWLAESLGKSMPPSASNEEPVSRKRGITSKRVLNQRLKAELGYKFNYPDFRAGYSVEIQRLGLRV